MLANAFNTLLSLHSRTVTLERPGVKTVTIKVTPSNYFRNLAGPEEIVIEGKEFVISKTFLDAVEFGVPKRGDRITDAQTGLAVISEVREMFAFGGTIIGFRVRTS